MIEKNLDNVHDETDQKTEQGERATMENGSTVLGKFKDVDALVRAYNALQAEFTRRSQRLKRLEKCDKRDEDQGHALKENSSTGGVEKLRKRAEEKRLHDEQFSAFVQEIENQKEDHSVVQVGETAEHSALPRGGVESENGQTLTDCTESVGVEGEKNVSDEQKSRFVDRKDGAFVQNSPTSLYDAVMGNEEVKTRIIGEYLASIRSPGVSLLGRGGATLTTPPKRPSSLEDASKLAYRYLKDGGSLSTENNF